MKEYSRRRGINRGYMKLEVWQNAIELYRVVWRTVNDANVEFKLRAQILDAAQSVSANVAEGYSRRSINEYIQHLYIALGSLSETLSRSIAFHETGQFTESQFEHIDAVHHEVENKLWRLVESLQKKRTDGTWIDRIAEETTTYEYDEKHE